MPSVEFESKPMKPGRRAGPRRSGSHGTRSVVTLAPAGQPPQPSPRALSVPGVIAFLRENGRRILMLAAVIFAIGVIVLMLIPRVTPPPRFVAVDPRIACHDRSGCCRDRDAAALREPCRDANRRLSRAADGSPKVAETTTSRRRPMPRACSTGSASGSKSPGAD